MGIFGFGKKKCYFNCPVCQREYWLEFDPAKLTDFDRRDYAKLSETTCGFCKTKISLSFHKGSKSILAEDIEWESYQVDFWKKHSDIEQCIEDLNESINALEEKGESAKQEKEKLKHLESQLKKMDSQYNKKESDYFEKQGRWSDKYDQSQS